MLTPISPQKLITAVRPLIIPKLKEENAKKNDKKPTRDYVHEDEFDASVFLLPVSTAHVMLNRVPSTSSNQEKLTCQTREFTFAEGDDEKPTLNTEYSGFPIYGKALCLVVDPPQSTSEAAGTSKQKRKSKKARGGIDEWFVNNPNEAPGIDDT